MTHFTDGLTNIMTGLGDPTRDKLAGASYAAPIERPRTYWANMVRSSGLAYRIVSAPAMDATREWREWSADASDISAIEKLERAFDVADQVRMALEDQRTVGRGFVYFDLGDDPSKPLNPATVKRGGLRFVRYIEEGGVADGDIESDPMSAGYGLPQWYDVASASSFVRIHPSRMIVLHGDRVLGGGGYHRRYDSILRRSEDAIRQHDLIRHNVAAMTSEAKVDVWTIKNLSRILSNPDSEAAFLNAARTSNMMKGVHGMLLLEGGDGDTPNTYDQKTISFATLPDVITKAEGHVSAVSGWSRDYLFSRENGGLGDNGKAVLEMDYGRVAQIQKAQIEPAMAIFDECLIRSAIGSRPADVYYNWRSLWSMSDKDRADIGKTIADTFKTIAEADLLPVEVMTPALVNALTEKAGLAVEQEYNDWTSGDGDNEDA